MLDVNQVWQRASQRPEFQGKKLSAFGIQAVVLRYNGLTPGQIVENQQQNFPNGAILLGVTGSAFVNGQVGGIQNPGLDLFAVSLEYQQQRQIIGTSKSMGSSVFGQRNDLFPAIELHIPTNGMLIWGFESLIATNNITITITSHCLVPVNVG